jgi:long-chain acyl-CoA synthetase
MPAARGIVMLISELLPAVADSNPSSAAIKHGSRTVTYGGLYRDALRLARAMRDEGIRPGDRVGLLGHPSIEFLIAEHAAVGIGAIPVGIFPSLAPVEIQSIVDDAQPAAIVFDAAHAGLAAQLHHTRPPLEIPCESIADLAGRHTPIDRWHQPAPDDPALIIYTGGTTGRPKGVVHTYRSISTWFKLNSPTVGYGPTSRTILFNLAHASGQTTVWMSCAAGGRLTLLDRYPATAAEIVDAMDADQITTLGTVSGTLRDILQVPEIERRNLGALKAVLVGGAFISAATLQRTAEVFPSALVIDAYALTESGQTISILPVGLALRTKRLDRLTSVGLPAATRLFNQTPFTVRIIDDDGRTLPAGQLGEIVVRGPQMMIGYWNNPEATARAIRDGWLYTGDIGRMDQDGYLYLVDRKKDMIIVSNGVCVYSSEVEAVVETHPAVAEVAVVATRLADACERVTAFASLRPGATLELDELQRFCVDRIASFKIPASLIVLPSLPRTNVGKIHKAQLRQICAVDAA